MQYSGCTDIHTHNKIVPLYMLVWGSLRLAPMIHKEKKYFGLCKM